MYSLGVPIGMFVDNQGSRPAVLAGSALLALGYFPLHQAYDRASGAVALLCFFSYLTGLGGCMAFSAAVKTSALNWPHNRGTATAFPLAAFGLSAFFFSLIGGLLFPGDPSDFLMLLSAGTCGLTFVGFFFLKVYPQSNNYQPLAGQNDGEHGDGDDPAPLRRTSSKESKSRRKNGLYDDYEPGTSTNASSSVRESATAVGDAPALDSQAIDETSSLLSNSSGDGDLVRRSHVDLDRSRRVDIRGLRLLRNLEFWQLFLIMGILAGIGLMTIKYDPSSPPPRSPNLTSFLIRTLATSEMMSKLCGSATTSP